MGIRLFGAQEVPQGVIKAGGEFFGAQTARRKVVVRVARHFIGHGSLADGRVALRREPPEVFGEAAGDIRIIWYEHFPHLGGVRPRWEDITLPSVPEGWPGVFISSALPWGHDRVWLVRGVHALPSAYDASECTRLQGPPFPHRGIRAKGGAEEGTVLLGRRLRRVTGPLPMRNANTSYIPALWAVARLRAKQGTRQMAGEGSRGVGDGRARVRGYRI